MIIGSTVDSFPNVMFPGDHYEEYFDLQTGEPLPLKGKDEPKEPEQGMEAPKPKPLPESPSEPVAVITEKPLTPPPAPKPAPAPQQKTQDTLVSEQKVMTQSAGGAVPIIKKPPETQANAKSDPNMDLVNTVLGLLDSMTKPTTARIQRKQAAESQPDNTETDRNPEEGNMAEDGQEAVDQAYQDYNLAIERLDLLHSILYEILCTIQRQAKKTPDAVISAYKVQKINANLKEIRDMYQNSGYEDLLELLEEPHKVMEDGVEHIEGTTYSDAEILLHYYVELMIHKSFS